MEGKNQHLTLPVPTSRPSPADGGYDVPPVAMREMTTWAQGWGHSLGLNSGAAPRAGTASPVVLL